MHMVAQHQRRQCLLLFLYASLWLRLSTADTEVPLRRRQLSAKVERPFSAKPSGFLARRDQNSTPIKPLQWPRTLHARLDLRTHQRCRQTSVKLL